MKTPQVITMASALFLAAGCAHEQHQVRYDESVSPAYSAGRMYNIPSQTGSGAYSEGMSGSVAPGKSDSQSDNTIAAAVRESLRRNAEIAPIVPNIQINVNNGAVVLNGSVQSEEQKRQIEAIAQEATGVVAVNNQLEILSNPAASRSNNQQMNPTSLPNGADQIYQQTNQEQNGQSQNTNNEMP